MDIDGTVCVGPVTIDGAIDTVSSIRERGIRLIFFTNDSSRSRAQIAKRLSDAGIECSPEDVMSSGFMAAQYVRDKGYERIFISGTDGLKEEFESQGIRSVDPKEADTLVIGMDFTIDYEKIKTAVNAAISASHIIICNRDRIFKCSADSVCPGCGAVVAAVEYCSGKNSEVMIGKPEPFMIEYICDQYGIGKGEILIVGDSYTSDIQMGLDNGTYTFQVSVDDDSMKKIGDLPTFLDEIIQRRSLIDCFTKNVSDSIFYHKFQLFDSFQI